ncbi:MAG TPA: GNAT family N-acetyltransferase [Dehalococcoidia bacterium]|nr:GNAT family N-acetyltransferase [Dehalococcoidia bacterium]
MTDTSYVIRNYHPADFDKYVLLCRESNELGPSGHPVSPGIAATWLEWPYYSPEKDLFLVESDGEIIGGLDLRTEPDINRVILRCWVKPQHRRKGLGKQLFSKALSRVKELGVRYIHVNIPEENKAARIMLNKSGFKPVRSYLDMKIDLSNIDGTEADKAASDCRCFKPGEEAKLTHLQNRAFAGQWGYNPNTPEMISYYTRLGGFSPEQVILVCDDEKIVGYCWVELVPSADVSGEQQGLIHMLGADPDYQRRGVGRKVLMAGLAYLMKKGVKTASLSVDSANHSAVNLYRSIGFVRQARNLWYENEVD